MNICKSLIVVLAVTCFGCARATRDPASLPRTLASIYDLDRYSNVFLHVPVLLAADLYPTLEEDHYGAADAFVQIPKSLPFRFASGRARAAAEAELPDLIRSVKSGAPRLLHSVCVAGVLERDAKAGLYLSVQDVMPLKLPAGCGVYVHP